jgi:hypothetical protein
MDGCSKHDRLCYILGPVRSGFFSNTFYLFGIHANDRVKATDFLRAQADASCFLGDRLIGVETEPRDRIWNVVPIAVVQSLPATRRFGPEVCKLLRATSTAYARGIYSACELEDEFDGSLVPHTRVQTVVCPRNFFSLHHRDVDRRSGAGGRPLACAEGGGGQIVPRRSDRGQPGDIRNHA